MVTVSVISPVPRIALTQEEACASLGCSEEYFVQHIRPAVKSLKGGRKRLFPISELERAVLKLAERVG